MLATKGVHVGGCLSRGAKVTSKKKGTPAHEEHPEDNDKDREKRNKNTHATCQGSS